MPRKNVKKTEYSDEINSLGKSLAFARKARDNANKAFLDAKKEMVKAMTSSGVNGYNGHGIRLVYEEHISYPGVPVRVKMPYRKAKKTWKVLVAKP